jgi:hypothetical protein
MKGILSIVLLCASIAVLAQSRCNSDPSQGGVDEAQVQAISEFESALAQKDIVKLGELVSPHIVVLENGYRNDGWQDFQDHHGTVDFEF